MSVTAGSMRLYLDPIEVVQVVHILLDSTSICARRFAVSQHGGDSRRQKVTLGELGRAVEGP